MKSNLRFAFNGATMALWLALVFTGSIRASRAQQPIELDVPAPELVGGPWLNTARNAPITLAARRGKVTIVEFWTFG